MVVLAIAIAGPGPSSAALAQTDADRADAGKLVEEGLGHARDGRFRQAAKLFEDALRLYPHPEIMHNMARAQEELANLAAAHTYFLKALEMDAGYTYAEEARKRVALIEDALRETHGQLRVTSVPSQVEVQLVQAGQTLASYLVTPVTFWVPKGQVKVEGAKSGFVDNTVAVEVSAGADVPVEIVLRPIPRKGFLAVAASVKGARVLVDGEGFGTTPVPPTPIPAGNHTVRVIADGYRRFETQVMVEADKERRVLADLVSLSEGAAGGDQAEADGTLGIVGGAMLGGGAAAAVAGVVLHVVAWKTAKDFSSEVNDGSDAYNARFDQTVSRVKNLQIGAGVSYGIAGALVATGVVLLVVSPGGDDEESASALDWTPSIAPLPGGAAAGALIRF